MSNVVNLVKVVSSANTAVTLTISASAASDARVFCESVMLSYSSSTPTGKLQIGDGDVDDGGTVRGEIDVYVPNLIWPFAPLYSSPGEELEFVVGAGGAGVVGKLVAEVG